MADAPVKARESVLEVPADLTRNCGGLAIDMGGSSLKFVYRTKEDVDEVTALNGKFGRLRLISFPRSDLQLGLDYVRSRAVHLSDNCSNSSFMIHSTGLGCTEYGERIRETLNVRLENLSEFDCFVKSFHYLAGRMPRRQLLEPFMVDTLTEPIEYVIGQAKVFATVYNIGTLTDEDTMYQTFDSKSGRSPADRIEPPNEVPLSEAETDLYPCLLVICGSAFCFIKIEQDGSFELLDASNRGGKSFVGVGTLLTGCKTFDELVELASKGQASEVDQSSYDLFAKKQSAEGDNSIYELYSQTKPKNAGLVYCFGKAAVGQGNFNPEDIAAAWLQYVVLDLLQVLHSVCIVNGIKRAFFCGGFAEHPVVRRYITTEFARRNMFLALMQPDVNQYVTFDFIKPGQHMGALGCLINGSTST